MKYAEGQIVAVCYDGKWTRAVEGKIVSVGPRRKMRTPAWLDVRFLPWANEESGFAAVRFKPRKPEPVRFGRPKKRSPGFGGWLSGGGENLVMRSLGLRGDWYSLADPNELADAGYMTKPYERQPRSDDGECTSRAIVKKWRT